MQALLHYHYPIVNPEGIWWVSPAGVLKCIYAPDARAAEVIGRQIMASKVPSVPWESFFQQLAERMPIGSGWELVELKELPETFFARLSKPAAA